MALVFKGLKLPGTVTLNNHVSKRFSSKRASLSSYVEPFSKRKQMLGACEPYYKKEYKLPEDRCKGRGQIQLFELHPLEKIYANELRQDLVDTDLVLFLHRNYIPLEPLRKLRNSITKLDGKLQILNNKIYKQAFGELQRPYVANFSYDDSGRKDKPTTSGSYRDTTTTPSTPDSSDPNQETRMTAARRRWTKTVVDTAIHYYHGFRLMFIDVRVCSRYLWKILHGEHLTRREHRQLVRTTSDLFRLVPFSVFIIVPFMEILLPFFIKIFPGMLPSTFQTTLEKDTKIKNQLKVKLDMAKFLQQTLDEMALQSKGESHSDSAKQFAKFFEEVRTSGKGASTMDIMKYSKLFEDEITLDSMTRQQLVACCKLLELQPIGTNAFLRFQLRMRLKALTADDEMIMKEGIDSLTVSELQAACRARGMRALGVPVERLQAQLLQWLDLNLNDKIPPSLLLLSRALYVPENIPTSEQLKVTIQSLPDIAATEVKYNIGESEGKVDNRTKLELIKQEEAEIRKEELQEAVEIYKSNYDDALIDFADEVIERAAKMNQPSILRIVKEKSEKNDLSIEFLESVDRDLDKLLSDHEELVSGKQPPEEEYDLRQIKEEMEDYHEEVEGHPEEIKEKGLRESKAARRLSKRVDKMINKLDKILDSMEEAKEKDKDQEKRSQ